MVLKFENWLVILPMVSPKDCMFIGNENDSISDMLLNTDEEAVPKLLFLLVNGPKIVDQGKTEISVKISDPNNIGRAPSQLVQKPHFELTRQTVGVLLPAAIRIVLGIGLTHQLKQREPTVS